ncbi:hypothetical protein [Streptomyces sp. NPDC046332]|uniref:hypothetical protein n=1 Tax=Streptomyces sp. NPDC046332 TaxID=3155133 RepID=UPI0033C3BD46
MAELKEIRRRLERLDDPTAGLTALHGDIAQSRLKVLEVVQTGVTGLREENREVRRRQDRMINDLHETRAELRQLLELAETLRTALPWAADSHQNGTAQELPENNLRQLPITSRVPAAHEVESAPSVTAPHATTETSTSQQGETVENTDLQQAPEQVGEDPALILKRAIEAEYHGSAEPVQASATQSPAPERRPGDEQVSHGALLLKAAGVASAELVAHRDTWEWLAALAGDHEHFRTPPAVEDMKEGRVRTVLSGRSLIALLIKLWSTRSTATPLEADWALATTAYNRMAAELADVTGQGEGLRIVLDDGLPHSAGD